MNKKFFTDAFDKEESNVTVFGVPFQEGSLNSLREVSWFVEPFDFDRRKNLLENVKIFDAGDLELKNLDEIKNKTQEIVSQKKIPLVLSDTHLSTYFTLQTMKDVKFLIFDAHTDTKDKYTDEKIIQNKNFENEKVNGSTWLRRFCEVGNPENIFLIGVRSCDEDDLKFLEEKKINFVSAKELKEHPTDVRSAIWEFTNESDVYISLDIDVFDPSIAPAVDYPEPNGIFFNDFQTLIQDINGKIVGMDLCCLKPIERNQVTEFLAVRSIFEILGKV